MANQILIRLSKASIRPYLPANSYAFEGPPVALRDITWTLKQGENWLCTGPNGSGKSTLARCLVGKANVVAGHFESRVRSSALVSFADHERVRTFTDFFLSHGADLKEEGLTVESFLPSTADAALTQTDFFRVKDFAKRNLASLSSGELRRLCLLRALNTKPDMLILDEAFDFLDGKKREILAEMLNDFAKRNPQTRIVLVSHRVLEDSFKLEFLTNHVDLSDDGRIAKITEFIPQPQPHLASSSEDDPISDPNVYMERTKQLVQVTQQFLSTARGVDRSDTDMNIEAVDIKEAKVTFDFGSPPVMFIHHLNVNQGDRVSLYGPSGAGKSLLLSIIAGRASSILLESSVGIWQADWGGRNPRSASKPCCPILTCKGPVAVHKQSLQTRSGRRSFNAPSF